MQLTVKALITSVLLLLVACTLCWHLNGQVRAERLKTAAAESERDQAVLTLRDQEKRYSAAIRASQRALQSSHKTTENKRAKIEAALSAPAKQWADQPVPESVLAALGVQHGVPSSEASAPAQ